MRNRFSPALALLLVLILPGCERVQDAALDAMARDRSDQSLLQSGNGLRVILCGTGSPQVNATRGQACTLVAAGGRLFLFDAGENAMRNLETSHVPVQALSQVFITHWHSDHFNGLGALINHGWVDGRRTPFLVYGPPGVEAVVGGLAQAYGQDASFRSAHGLPSTSRQLAFAEPRRVEIAAGQESVRVYDEGGVTIDAYRVDHFPVDPAYGYVLRYQGKKLFISGDTRVSERYFEAMRDADLVVHEAINTHLIHEGAAALERTGQKTRAEQALHVLDYHADTLELARMAQRAGVRHLLLTHLIPAPDNFLARRLFVSGMADEYSGEITLGEDALDLSL
ncbi:MBL fold metallo-hydrolase [Pseudomonas sp. ZM23]|uniref:MBL fold metallo-hydrolase n=1 Tax=Pseudomonas triclosanedens TaxID=2961893 RepID=A0ABY6ZQB5_9PSED|nr:MBL fold metallo-hydrolase [Pseudomonas triclosanedens]MCP8467634.1 MBL fold metallo-hydrolase [Pseudomonas triclosanedens]MCP8473380.1 MBL fold metallo-hydrolase [Pseudomonas triclosanedens]MCP8479409.1 MBL fold metallo-hydrolase [Pseudomonas triclosanedens]WAI47102.1 MBL fold metallo-hydrolase [Pseudomonas triclosanedens]